MSVETHKNKTGDTVYAIRYRDAQGRSRRETLGSGLEGWNKREARKVEQERLAGRTIAPPFHDVAWGWFIMTQPNWKPRTKAAYRRSINRLEALWEAPIDSVRPRNISDWIQGQSAKYSAKTVNDDISVLHQIFDYAIRQEYITGNPASAAPRPKVRQKKWRILTPEEIQKVDKAFETIPFLDKNNRWDEAKSRRQAQLMFRLLTRTGIRRDELRNLKVGDIDFDRSVIRIRVSKTEEGERSIAIPRSLSSELKEWCEGGD